MKTINKKTEKTNKPKTKNEPLKKAKKVTKDKAKKLKGGHGGWSCEHVEGPWRLLR